MSSVSPTFAETPAVTPIDRLGFTLFMAVALHAVVILGSNFVTEKPKPLSQTLEITLAQYKSEKAPEKADFLAQQNQQGSGTVEEKRLLSTTEASTFQDTEIHDQAAQAPTPVETPAPNPTPEPVVEKPTSKVVVKNKQEIDRKVVTTTKPQKIKTPEKTKKTTEAKAQPSAGQSTSLLARSLEIANLQAQIKMQQEQFSKRPKTRRLTSVSTAAHEDAIYLDNWRRRIEMIGNLNYPQEARKNSLYGTLRVLVAIYPDGSLKNVEILQSSGVKTLDDAAVRIVQLAAPFQPFSVEMRKSTDVLEIIRTWKFEKTTHVY